MAPINLRVRDLRDGDAIAFENDDGTGHTYRTVRKVWHYDDGSIVLEYKGRDPGLWRYAGDRLNIRVMVRRNGRK